MLIKNSSIILSMIFRKNIKRIQGGKYYLGKGIMINLHWRKIIRMENLSMFSTGD